MIKWMRCSILALLFAFSAQAVEVKETAPQTYVVKKGDTLWDISSMYLAHPWLWPALWQNNTYIENPHLIYPGDRLTLVFNEDGEPQLELARDPENVKPTIKLSPQGRKVFKPQPISTLPWSMIAAFAQKGWVISDEKLQSMPVILGDADGSSRFVEHQVVLSERLSESADQVITRKQAPLYDMDDNLIGWQILKVADVSEVDTQSGASSVLYIEQSSMEARRGDRVMTAMQEYKDKFLNLIPATNQRGHVLASLQGNKLMGRFDVVALDLGQNEVLPGTVLGLYRQGPAILNNDTPTYENDGTQMDKLVGQIEERVQQPAFKVGEVVVFKVFDKSSYALITKASKSIKRGAIVAQP